MTQVLTNISDPAWWYEKRSLEVQGTRNTGDTVDELTDVRSG